MSGAKKTPTQTASPTRRWIGGTSPVLLYALLLFFAGGIVSAELFNVGRYEALLISLIGVSCALALPRRAVSIVLLCAALSLGVARMEWSEASLPDLTSVAGTYQTLAGSVVRDPESRAGSVRVVLAVHSPESLAGANMLVTLPPGAPVRYGDALVLRGRIELPRSFTTSVGRVFDYPGYLKAQGISATVRTPAIVSREPGGNAVLTALYTLKHSFERALSKSLTEPSASLARGILLGEQGSIPEPLYEDFVRAGLVHLLVLSGYNITLVADFLRRPFGNRKRGLVVASLGIVAFVVMTGAQETAVRAGVMGLFVLFAQALGRPSLMLRFLFLAGGGMVAWNPYLLLGSPSFALSFLATLGLIVLSPRFETFLIRVPTYAGMRTISAATLATQLFVLPYILWMTGFFSPVSVPANLLVLPLMPLIMLISFAAGVVGLISPLLAALPGFGASALLSYVAFVGEGVARIPLALTLPPIPVWGMLLLYALLAAWLLFFKKLPRTAPPRHSS